MKFMKLGSKPDTFYITETIRSVSSEVSSDLIVQVKGCRYLLHKFPLLSKSLRLQTVCAENQEQSQPQIIELPDFPGGIEAFELCAKFCYNITITLSAYNVVASRCAAEYLQMTEDVEKGNLISKIEAFFNSCILLGWKDTIVTLLSTRSFVPLSEELGITSRCIEAIGCKVLEKPSKTSYSRKGGKDGGVSGSGIESNWWWAEDIAELGLDLYWRTMVAIKSGGKVSSALIGDALKIYATRWLPNRCSNNQFESKHRLILDSIVSLLPAEKHSVSCSFLSKLLKAANIVKATSSTKLELAKKMGIQLDHATVNDLLIPLSSSSGNNIVYDVDIVIAILEQFMLQPLSPPTSPLKTKESIQKRRSFSAENIDFELQERRRSSSSSSNTHSSKLKVAKIVDGYLQEIAKDVNLPMNKFMAVADFVPEFARVEHDDLYKAIDIYLKVHQELNKSEKKRLCKILDCRKLSMQTCTHAAQNELLPLRLVVQVLFFDQARSAISGPQTNNNELPRRITALLSTQDDDHSSKTATSSNKNNTMTSRADDQWSVSRTKSSKTTVSTLKMKMDEEEGEDDDDNVMVDEKYKSSKAKSFCMIPYRPKRMLSKLWPVNRSVSEKNSM